MSPLPATARSSSPALPSTPGRRSTCPSTARPSTSRCYPPTSRPMCWCRTSSRTAAASSSSPSSASPTRGCIGPALTSRSSCWGWTSMTRPLARSPPPGPMAWPPGSWTPTTIGAVSWSARPSFPALGEVPIPGRAWSRPARLGRPRCLRDAAWHDLAAVLGWRAGARRHQGHRLPRQRGHQDPRVA